MSQGNGGLPQGWVEATLGEVAVARVSQTGPSGEKDFTYIDISSVDNQQKRIVEPKLLPVTDAPSRARQNVQVGDVLVSMTRPNLNAVAVVPEELDGAVASTGFHVLRGTQVEPDWLFAIVRSPAFVAHMSELVQGALYPAVRASDVRGFTFPLPPLPEQRRIVARIEELQARTRRAREALEGVPALLERFRQSVLASAFRGDLTAGWRKRNPDVEPASALLERIRAERRRRWEEAELERMRAKGREPTDDRWKQKYREPEPVDASGLPELPQGWAWASVADVIVDGPQNGLYLPRTAYGSGTPIIRIDDFQSDWSRASDGLQRVEADTTTIRAYSLHEGDVIINRVNSPSHLGKCLAVEQRNLPALFESNMMRLRCSAELDPHFLVGWLSSPEGRNLLTRSAKWAVNQASINQQDVTSTPIPLAPPAEQARVVAAITQARCELRVVRSAVGEGISNADRLDQSILARAFRGELVPQDPSDEPASALLERLRAEGAWQPRRGGRPRG